MADDHRREAKDQRPIYCGVQRESPRKDQSRPVERHKGENPSLGDAQDRIFGASGCPPNAVPKRTSPERELLRLWCAHLCTCPQFLSPRRAQHPIVDAHCPLRAGDRPHYTKVAIGCQRFFKQSDTTGTGWDKDSRTKAPGNGSGRTDDRRSRCCLAVQSLPPGFDHTGRLGTAVWFD